MTAFFVAPTYIFVIFIHAALHRVVASMRKDEAIASSRFWSKIDFSDPLLIQLRRLPRIEVSNTW